MRLSQTALRAVATWLKKPYRLCLFLLIAISLCLMLAPASHALKTIDTTNASVVVDGRPVFRVEPSQAYTAQQRANQANRQLLLLANLVKETSVKVVERNQQPTIVANGQYLLTVTDLDTTLYNARQNALGAGGRVG